jgi:glycosyltransferase involved in cell wall biosynthesis
MTEPEYPPDATVRGVYRRIERRTVEGASRVVFTTPGTRRMYAERYPHVPDTRWAVIPNGYDEESFLEVERTASPHPAGGSPTVLVHSGLLYPSERDPGAFFSAIAALRQEGTISPSTLQVVLRASGSEELYRARLREEGIDDIVRLEPPVGYRAALAEILSADGLLLFQAANCNHQIPAKIYEYLRARRPIFAMTDSRGDTAHLLADSGVDTVVPLDSEPRIIEGLGRFLAAIRNGAAPMPKPSEVGQHSRRSTSCASTLRSISRPAKNIMCASCGNLGRAART